MQYRVAIGPSSFAAEDKTPLRLLESFGIKVVPNPYSRRLTAPEIMEHLKNDDGTTTEIKSNRMTELMNLLDEVEGKVIIWGNILGRGSNSLDNFGISAERIQAAIGRMQEAAISQT